MDSNLLIIAPIFLVSILIAMSLHEMMHAWMSNILGDDTAKRQGRLTLNPIKHIHPFYTLLLPLISYIIFKVPIAAAKPVPFTPHALRFGQYGMALVAAAGPLTNLLLAFIGSAALKFSGGANLLSDALIIFTHLNVALFVFNMLPIPPLDGSRVLYVFMPNAIRRFMDMMEAFGLFLFLIIVLIAWQYFPFFKDFLFWANKTILNFFL